MAGIGLDTPDPSSLAGGLSSLPSIASSLGSAASAVSQGEAIFDAVAGAADGNYAGLAAAAQGIVSFLPAGKVTDLLHDAVGIAEGAASGAAAGAALGSVFPVLGNAVGAEVGAVIGGGIQVVEDVLPLLEKDHFNPFKIASDIVGAVVGIFDPSKPAQGDFRYLSDKICFPEVDPSSPYGLIPGVERYNPRCNPQSTFYQTPSGPNQAWSLQFTFLTGWRSPPGSTDATKKAAWLLAQYYTQPFSQTLGHTNAAPITMNALVTALGSKAKAVAAVASLGRWYGQPSAFSPILPYAASQGKAPPNDNQAASQTAVLAEFAAHPLDRLYYPIPVHWDSGSSQLQPTALKNATSVMLAADTFLCLLSECAVLGYSDNAVFHIALQNQHYWVTGRKKDTVQYPGLSVDKHPNFSRVIGYTATLIKNSQKGKTASTYSQKGLATAKAFASGKIPPPPLPQGGAGPSTNAPAALPASTGGYAPSTGSSPRQDKPLTPTPSSDSVQSTGFPWLPVAGAAVGVGLLALHASRKTP